MALSKKTTSPLRKLKSSPKERLEARIGSDQKKLFQKAASLKGKTLTDFLIEAAQQEAIKTIKECDVIFLGLKDQNLFVQKLLDDEEPNDTLKSAAKSYLED